MDHKAETIGSRRLVEKFRLGNQRAWIWVVAVEVGCGGSG